MENDPIYYDECSIVDDRFYDKFIVSLEQAKRIMEEGWWDENKFMVGTPIVKYTREQIRKKYE